MKRLPIRARLTAAFALTMLAVLSAATAFVYLSVRENLDDGVDATLETRVAALAGAARRSDVPLADVGGQPLEDPEEGFAQIVSTDGRVLYTTPNVGGGVLEPAVLRKAAANEAVVERTVPGVEATARILARPFTTGDSSLVAVVGQSLEDRDETLAGLLAAFAIGGPAAVAVACALGYLLATAGLRPIEAMRRRAASVSLDRDGEQLPLPAARDEVRRLGETLNDMLARLRRSFDRERRFVADASHELRTPVAIVKAELEGALRTGDFGPEVREALVAAVEECDHLAQLAEDLLVIARSADGRLPVKRERVQALPLLEGVRQRFADRAAAAGRELHLRAPADLSVDADPLRLRQALGNLVDNALRHGRGDVTLAARPAESGVELEVADHGPGFSRAVAERAFERFARGDEARTGAGTGLGLAIVRAIAEAHGGSARIAPESRAAVRLWLPGVDATVPQASAPGDRERRSEPSQGPLSQAPYGGP